MDTQPQAENPRARGVRRLLQTVTLLRSGARDTDEAEFYLSEEKRLARQLTKLQTEGAGSDAALAA